MPEPITRVYASRATADAAAEALKEAGFGEIAVFGGESDAMAQDSVAAAMRTAGVPQRAAAALAAGVAQGRAVVAVTPAFGRAMRATTVLDSHAPIAEAEADAGADETHAAALDVGPAGDATPFSTAMGWNVLSKSATPFSDWLSLKVLSPDRLPFSSYWGFPLLSKRRHMGWFGKKLLSSEPTPMSKLLNMKPLLSEPTPFSSRFKFRLLTETPTPLSTRFNLQLLSSEPHPLSSRLRLPLLTERRQ